MYPALRPYEQRSRSRLRDAILSLQPTAYWPLDDGSGPLRSLVGGWNATVTGSPTYGVAAREPIGRGVTWSGSGQYATTSTAIPNPASAMTVMVIFRVTDATAAVRALAARAGEVNQNSWTLHLNGSHNLAFQALQAGGSAHAATSTSGTVNDGAIHVGTGTFDGSTITVRFDGNAVASSTSLTGAWHVASTSGLMIAHRNGSTLLPGTEYGVIYWTRAISQSEHLFIQNIARGG